MGSFVEILRIPTSGNHMVMVVKTSSGNTWRKKIPEDTFLDISFSNRVPRIKRRDNNALVKGIKLPGFDPLIESIINVKVEHGDE